MKRVLFIALGALIALSGCTWVGTSENVQPFESDRVDISQSFYMVYPKNGVEQTYFTASLEESETSAQDVSDVFYKKFYQKFGTLTVSDKNMSLDDGFKTAKTRGDKYLIAMDINEWKDSFYMTCRASSYQGQMTAMNQAMDTADVTISVYDVNLQKLLNKQRVQNSGCPIVFLAVIPIGKNSPDSRFNSSLDEWLENLQTDTTE